MSYVSLARKYRPRRFVDMVGQETSTLALTNSIRLGRESHSVIFTGVRGIGKTTTARLYAKALNCEQGPVAEPCDICASCRAITQGNHEDVLEIDGASNTGVDDVRALQETLSYVPQRSTFKIYIIDEVHMLSISAFNALLKTLEEPPKHVIFIFATTELQKVPETIQSRCQIFHLQKISRPVIADRIRSILEAEKIAFEEAAVSILAREGRGSLRDSLTMLDQAIALGGGKVSVEALRQMIGSSQFMPVFQLLEALLLKDAAVILELISRWDQEGLAMSTLVEELAKACRNAFILRDLKAQPIDLQILQLEDREQQTLLELGNKAAPLDLNRLFRQLIKCLDDLRHADLDRFVFENYCLEWCFDPGLPDMQSLQNILSGMPVSAASNAARPSPPIESAPVNLRERWKTSGITAAVESKAVPQAASPVPQAASPVPQAASPVPQAASPVPQAASPVPQAASPVPQAASIPTLPKQAASVLEHKTTIPASRAPAAAAPSHSTVPSPVDRVPTKTDESIGPLKKLQSMAAQAFPQQGEVQKPHEAPMPKDLPGPVIAVPVFPLEWRTFVDEWKKQKPLQGRILEEAYMLEYSPQRIRLAVEPQSMAGGKLLQPDIRKRLLEQFGQVFGFQGQLDVVAKAQQSTELSSGPKGSIEPSENLLAVKNRERELAREKLRQRVEEHPMTREVISQFGGTIEQIELQ
ncbi:MAG: DNA polymerase III subunit gamma/tau [Proteobacteria bacterium]|nr:DNA polymerase III subunit gamma/tau [Pseudomonadota bacterium]